MKTESKLSLDVATMHRLVGCAVLAFDDAYRITSAGIFSARYGYLATWDLGAPLDELAGRHVDLASVRQEFRQLLLAYRLSLSSVGQSKGGWNATRPYSTARDRW